MNAGCVYLFIKFFSILGIYLAHMMMITGRDWNSSGIGNLCAGKSISRGKSTYSLFSSRIDLLITISERL